MQLTGSQIVIECLKEQGVDTVFGYPGGAILNIYDELYRHQNEIRHILTSHEQGASHAADGYARSTGRVGVCMATSGPGATNLVTGIATAHMDSVPLVAITCNVGVPLLGKDSFQEVDIAGVTMPITKYSFLVKDVRIWQEHSAVHLRLPRQVVRVRFLSTLQRMSPPIRQSLSLRCLRLFRAQQSRWRQHPLRRH